jgi:hypothetical protein
VGFFSFHDLRQRIPQKVEKSKSSSSFCRFPGFIYDCFAGCEAQHQQTAFAKKKSHDAMFFVISDAEEPVGGTRRSR